jgi:hypothetical protein
MALMGARHGYARTALALTRSLAEASPLIKGGAENVIKAMGNKLKTTDWNMVHVLRDQLLEKKGADRVGINALANELIRTGLADHTQLQDIRQEINPSGAVGTGVNKVWNIFLNSNAAMAHAVDVMNKFAVAKAAYDLELRKSGGNRAAALDYAMKTARRVMPNYTTANRERIAQHPIGSALLQFKRYGMHMYALLANLAREASHGDQKWEATKALAGVLGTHAMMAGVLTLIADPLRYIGGAYDVATGASTFKNREPAARGFINDIFGKELGEIVARGLPHAFGVDLHRRVGLANLMEMPEANGFTKEGAGQVLLGLATGATGENLQNMVKGAAAITHGDVGGFLTGIMPRPIRDAIKGVNIATQGVKDSAGEVTLPPEKIGVGGGIAQALGFQPSEVSEFREGRNAVLQAREEQRAAHAQLTSAWLSAAPADRPAIMSQIREFNSDPHNVGSRITMQQLLRDQVQRRKQAATPFGLRLPRRGAAELNQAGAFANF